jgi:apolipoprotein N-acyltransferase
MKFDLSQGTEAKVFRIAPRAPAPGTEGGVAGAAAAQAAPGAGSPEPVRVVAPICFEVTYSDLTRSMVFGPSGRRADVMVCVTNDGWFGTWDAGRELHLTVARWRSVELGTPMVRAANTGVSSVIGPRGELVARGVRVVGGARDGTVDEYGHEVAGVLVADVPLGSGVTLFARIGNLVGWTMFVLMGGLVGLACVRRPRPGMTVIRTDGATGGGA